MFVVDDLDCWLVCVDGANFMGDFQPEWWIRTPVSSAAPVVSKMQTFQIASFLFGYFLICYIPDKV